MTRQIVEMPIAIELLHIFAISKIIEISSFVVELDYSSQNSIPIVRIGEKV